jgi:SAM-dependent methyltransferase
MRCASTAGGVRFVTGRLGGHSPCSHLASIGMGLRGEWENQARNWIKFATTPGHDEGFWRFGLHHFLALLPGPAGLTIDLGCGEGRLPRLLRERGYTVVGVDASPTLIAQAADLGPAHYIAADAAHLPVRDACADLVVAYMSLHDIDDMEAAVAEAGRVLVSGGRLCFAILHPIGTAGAYSERSADAPFVIAGSYLEPRRYSYYTDRDGIPMTFHSMHRPLGAYVDAVVTAGLLLEALREPPIDKVFVDEDPSEVRWRRLPMYLFISAIKV